ncbi:hypothetical protein GLW08_06930 [Pontibacillus yanchengensis]|uniref:Uncharacterized protein n=2 Tax=Pontibacillus yanchengensis TaxID=462910 RepID=A0A6I4ZX12_9BACI|nr:hypothetical protein [Pontibacillus yanchengensis]MYL32490.1 hypothetical protein [Pontibacillus yanchengensis]MYL53071.1 hypothetical protein [Pontibacillus yanchengensis]
MLTDWSQMSLGRVLTLVIAFGFLMLWMQVTVWHHRGKFHKWQMWIPVIALPLLAFSGFLVVVYPEPWTGWIQTILTSIGVIAGMYGGILHLVAISKRTGGFVYENLQSGPPFILPFTIAAFSIMQLFNLWY